VLAVGVARGDAVGGEVGEREQQPIALSILLDTSTSMDKKLPIARRFCGQLPRSYDGSPGFSQVELNCTKLPLSGVSVTQCDTV
jgi:hypothetical protein